MAPRGKAPPSPPAAGGDPRGFAVLIGRYLEALAVRNYSPKTIYHAGQLLAMFSRWCGERGMSRPSEVTRSVLERYQRWLYHYRRGNGRALAVGTQAQRLMRVKSFYKWLARERYLLSDPASGLELPKRPQPLPIDGFSLAEVEQILATPDVSEPLGLRDRAMLEVLYSTGIRRAELARLDVYDLDVDRGWVAVRRGKGGKDRVVPIGERGLAWVLAYVREARPELVLHADERALFVSAEGLRFRPAGIGDRVASLIERSAVRKRRGAAHLFRHTCATLMLEGGADVRYVQEMLGHASLEATKVYTRVAIAKLKQVHTATHPGARLERTSELAAALAAAAGNDGAAGTEDAGRDADAAGDDATGGGDGGGAPPGAPDPSRPETTS